MFASFSFRRRALSLIAAVALFLPFSTSRAESEEEAYQRVIEERAAKISQEITFTDEDHKLRVRKLIVDQYRTLRDIHAARDSQLSGAKDASSITAFEEQAKLAMFVAHNRFLAQLSSELRCDQVEQVKDGLTYGVVNHTYNGYLAQLPTLKEDEKRTIRAYLIEARELAMDGGSADEKHGVFRKYKGKINNYLSAAGYKM